MIDKIFSETKQVVARSTPQAGTKKTRSARYYRKMKEEECDQCDNKTTKVNAMKDHKRVKHVGEKKKCSKCEYSHAYTTKIRQHYKQVHNKIRPQWNQRMHTCREISCKDFGTPSCLKIEIHSLYFCNLCPSLSFKRSDKLKFHVDKVHKG